MWEYPIELLQGSQEPPKQYGMSPVFLVTYWNMIVRPQFDYRTWVKQARIIWKFLPGWLAFTVPYGAMRERGHQQCYSAVNPASHNRHHPDKMCHLMQ